MTILYLLVCIISAFLLGVIVCNYYFVIPVQQSNSRLIGKLNQKDWQITEWRLAYEKANNDFMKLAEIHNSVIKPEGTLGVELNDC